MPFRRYGIGRLVRPDKRPTSSLFSHKQQDLLSKKCRLMTGHGPRCSSPAAWLGRTPSVPLPQPISTRSRKNLRRTRKESHHGGETCSRAMLRSLHLLSWRQLTFDWIGVISLPTSVPWMRSIELGMSPLLWMGFPRLSSRQHDPLSNYKARAWRGHRPEPLHLGQMRNHASEKLALLATSTPKRLSILEPTILFRWKSRLSRTRQSKALKSATNSGAWAPLVHSPPTTLRSFPLTPALSSMKAH